MAMHGGASSPHPLGACHCGCGTCPVSVASVQASAESAAAEWGLRAHDV